MSLSISTSLIKIFYTGCDYLSKNYRWTLPVIIGFYYFLSNLLFKYGLDDSVSYLNAWHHIGSAGFWEVLQARIGVFFTPPPPESTGLFRPMRSGHSILAVYLSQYIYFLPDLITSATAGLLAFILIKFMEAESVPKPLVVCSTLWFFGCIPVVAMGHVVLVSQFFVILGIFLTVWLFHKHIETGKAKYLGLSLLVIFVFSFYAEAVLIAAVSIGFYGLIAFWNKQWKVGGISFAVSLTAALLVVSNAFLLTFDPGQIARTFASVLSVRGHSVSDAADLGIFSLIWKQVVNYFNIFRSHTFTGIIFSISPYLFILSLGVFVVSLIHKRDYRVPAVIGVLVVAGLLLSKSLLFVMGWSMIIIPLYYARAYPLHASIFFGALAVLGPIFVIDTHVTYLLPAIGFFLLKILFDAYKSVSWKYFQYAFRAALLLLPLILLGNYFNGSYLSYAVVNDNETIARELKPVLESEIILTNSRHTLDFYALADLGRDIKKLRKKLTFTANAPGMFKKNEVPTQAKFENWITGKGEDKSVYALYADCKRLPCKGYFSAPRYLDSEVCPKSLAWSHTLDVSVPNFDPGFLLVPYFYSRSLTSNFIAYPIFPDMMTAVGVEYRPFWKRVFVTYRLFKYNCGSSPRDRASQGARDWIVEKVRSGYQGFDIWMANGMYAAKPTGEGFFSSEDLSQNFSSYDFNAVMGFIDLHSNPGRFKILKDNYRDFTLVSHKNRFYAVPKEQWQSETVAIDQVIYGCNFGQLKKLIDDYYVRSELSPVTISASSQLKFYGPEHLLEKYKGNPAHIWHTEKSPRYPQWVQFKFSRPEKIYKIDISGQTGKPHFAKRAPMEFIIQAGNDGTHWENLLKVKDAGFTFEDIRKVFLLKNKQSYTHYRIFITANGGDPAVMNIQQIVLN